jgi:hypothetical protein
LHVQPQADRHSCRGSYRRPHRSTATSRSVAGRDGAPRHPQDASQARPRGRDRRHSLSHGYLMWLNDSFEKVEPSSGVNRPNNGYHVSDKLKTAYAVRVHLWGRRDRPPVMWAEKAILQRVSLVLLVELWAAVCDETSSGRVPREGHRHSRCLRRARVGGAPPSPRRWTSAAATCTITGTCKSREAPSQAARRPPGASARESQADPRRGLARKGSGAHRGAISGDGGSLAAAGAQGTRRR